MLKCDLPSDFTRYGRSKRWDSNPRPSPSRGCSNPAELLFEIVRVSPRLSRLQLTFTPRTLLAGLLAPWAATRSGSRFGGAYLWDAPTSPFTALRRVRQSSPASQRSVMYLPTAFAPALRSGTLGSGRHSVRLGGISRAGLDAAQPIKGTSNRLRNSSFRGTVDLQSDVSERLARDGS